MAAPQLKTARLLKSYVMPVDPTAFAGVPSVTALKLLPAGDVLIAAAMDRRVVCCDLKAESPKRIPAKHLAWSHDNWVHTLDVHPDGKRVATGGADRRIKFWRWGREERLSEFQAHDDWVRAVAFSPDGHRLASTGDDGQVKVWTLTDATEEPSPDSFTVTAVKTMIDHERDGGPVLAHAGCLDTLAWSPDGKRLLSSGNDGKVRVWDVETGKLARNTDVDNRRYIEDEPLNGGFSYPGGVRRLTCSPDGKLIAAVGLTSLHVLDLASGKQTLTQAGRGFGVAFDPHTRRLAFSQEKDLVVWDFPAGGITHRIAVDQLGQFGICFLKDGQHLASGGCNGWVGVWDLG